MAEAPLLSPEVLEMKTALGIIESYLMVRSRNTARSYRSVLFEWIEWCEPEGWFGRSRFLKATKDDGLKYYKHLATLPGLLSKDGRSSDCTDQTVERKLIILKTFYAWLIDGDGFRRGNPFDFPVKKASSLPVKQPTRALSAKQALLVLKAFPGSDYESLMHTAILSLLFGCALRRSEICTIRIADFLVDTHELILAEQKNRQVTTAPLADWVWEAMSKFLALRTDAKSSDPLFIKKQGPRHKSSNKLSDSYVRRLFKEAIKLAGLPDLYSCHSARATAITQLYDQELGTREIQSFARHSSGTMTERYDKRREKAGRKAALAIDYGNKNASLK